MSLKGIHPDVVFQQVPATGEMKDYIDAMNKARMVNEGKLHSRKLKKDMVENPSKYDLTEDQIEAVKKVMAGISI